MEAQPKQGVSDYPGLFSPVRLETVPLANRVVVSPMTRISATRDGLATEQMADYYARFAKGGFALVMTEGTYPDEAFSQGYAGQPGIANTAQAEAWRTVVDRVHAAGAPIFLQIMHAGALVQYNRFREVSVAPSAVPPVGEQLAMYGGRGPFPTPQALSETGLIEAIDGFVVAAKRARDVGFDGIEIHGANGYLLDQFLTDYTNQRDDDYGGTLGDRLRFPRIVVRNVREAVGDDYPVGIRISQTKVNDYDYRWPGGEDDAAVIFPALAETGASYIHLCGAEGVDPGPDGRPSMAALAKKYGNGIPVIGNGGLDDPARAEALLESGAADLVSLARGALANPDWPKLVADGKSRRTFTKDILAPLAVLDNQMQWEREHGVELYEGGGR